MDRLDDLSLFLRVLDLGSITAAALSLDLSPALASQRLARLESTLGVRLLHRTTRSLKPTPEGLALADQGRELVDELGTLLSSLRPGNKGLSGILRLTTSATFGRLYLSPLLAEFLRLHPLLQISVDLSDTVVDLVSSGHDLAVRIGALEDSSLIARQLAPNRRVLCAAPDYLRRHGEPRTPQQLEQHDCLLLNGARGRQDVWRLSDGQGGEVKVRVHGRLESSMGEFLRDAAVAGQGIALHSTWHVADDLRNGRLQVVLPDYPPATTGIHAVMPHRRLVPPRVQAFVDFLAEHLRHPPWER